jgi:hypothetical protein
MTQKLLHHPDIAPGINQVGSETMPQGMGMNVLL